MGCWKKIEKLGRGTFGEVFLASDEPSSRFIAVKSVDCSRHAVESLKKEATMLIQLIGTPDVVQCYGEDLSVENGRLVYNLLLDYAPGGSLCDLISMTYSSGKTLRETHVALYASMLLKALAGIHSKGIVHCDLKPANILIFPEVCCGVLVNRLKLADFGSARKVSEKEEFRVTYSGGTMTYTKTTLPYASPESVSTGHHGTYTDIWSFGCILIEMMTGKLAWNFENYADLVGQILNGSFLLPRRLSSADGVDFLFRCLDMDPRYRWSAVQLLNHPLILRNLKFFSLIHGVDFTNMEDPICYQENPFGPSERVTRNHLFSNGYQQPEEEEALRQQSPEQLQFQPETRGPELISLQHVGMVHSSWMPQTTLKIGTF